MAVEVIFFFETCFFISISDGGLTLQLISNDLVSVLLALFKDAGRKGEVTIKEDCSSLSAFLDRILIPKPPCCTGKPKRAYSGLLGMGLFTAHVEH